MREMTLGAWLAEGAALFGLDYDKWAFKCPACGHVARIGDFRQFKDRGATPDSAATECIGRYTLDMSRDGSSGQHQKMIRKQMKNGGPCDWAAYGLFNICATMVIAENGKPRAVFEFAQPPS